MNTWDVGVVAATIDGDVVLKMTAAQADELREQLVFLTSADENFAQRW